ncbi:putative ubiquitin conjugating enzyme [Schistosoma mansoni]|uniref:putative ubiquitin conjugating enzyme n=1 Tax=Schistosoma mansoni TaxID=6183 RepID=UPI0001A64040|nr:putative ubiquitin conjugating enzyme [Schistosoma mansoni]|eukprot:XP_018651314.1 putative ubiquitin conjugating enzyme [Schistosoma mansoni]
MPKYRIVHWAHIRIQNAVTSLRSPGLRRHLLKIDRQVKILVTELCRYKNLPNPPELNNLCPDFNPEPLPVDTISTAEPRQSSSGDGNSDAEDTGFEDEDVTLNDPFEVSITGDDRPEYDGISSQDAEQLEKLKATQIQGITKGSIQSSDRLMKELREIYRSDSYKQGIFTVELQNDSLYNWKVKLYKVDEDSGLHKDLQELTNHPKLEDHLGLQFLFKETYPFEPPFVRILYPVIENGYVLAGGAICMELFTKQGWSSAYDIESSIMQIAATLVKGRARINFSATDDQYSLRRAQLSYRGLVQIHEESGWYTPPKADG